LARHTYGFVGILDQNNDGVVDAGDITNLNNLSATTSITGNTANMNLTLPSTNASTIVATQNIKTTNSTTTVQSYTLTFQISSLIKLPVAVTLSTNSNADGANAVTPMDVASCFTSGNNCGHGFQISLPLNATSPTVGDTYNFNITYSDATTGTATATVTAVLTSFATNLSPTTGISTSQKPTFTWTYPSDPTSQYVYQFNLCCSSTGNVWQIPGNNSNTNGFTSSQIPMPTGIPWNTDPTGSNSLPVSPYGANGLTLGTTYTWQIQVQDSNGNTAVQQVTYQP
jgi:hypothetical protein